jgi:hypothetical protein
MTGGPSQVDTFDYKPELQRRDGQVLAGADPRTGFFTTSGRCLKSPFAFRQHGQSGSWVSELLPHTARHVDDMAFLHSCYTSQNNHAPASIELMTGQNRPGYPSMGSWLTYGLGTLNENLPAFVVMHETKPRGDDNIWTPGFLPKSNQPLTLDALTEWLASGKHGTIRVQDYYDRARHDANDVRFVTGSDVVGPMGPDLVPVDAARVGKFEKDHGGTSALALADIDEKALQP